MRWTPHFKKKMREGAEKTCKKARIWTPLPFRKFREVDPPHFKKKREVAEKNAETTKTCLGGLLR